MTSCRETCSLHFHSRWPSEWTLTLEVTGSSRTLVPTQHKVWHHNSDNTDIRLWGAAASFQNLVELADKLDTQLTQGRNFIFSYWYICCACWTRKRTMKCEVKAVGKQPLSETERNGRTTLKWISGKCAMGVLTKFRICYEIVCHSVYCEHTTLRRNAENSLCPWKQMSKWERVISVSHSTSSKSTRPQHCSYGSPRLPIPGTQVEF